jgi:hypothetical protein
VTARTVCLLLCCALPALAQTPAHDSSAIGRVVRIRVTTQTNGREPAVTGNLVRERGRLQRVDRLRSVSDTVGTDWVLGDTVAGVMRLHSPAQRLTQVVRLADLRMLYRDALGATVDSAINEIEQLGPGDVVLARPTVRVRIVTRMYLRLRGADASQVLAIASTTDALIDTTQTPLDAAGSVTKTTIGDGSSLLLEVFGSDSARVLRRSGTMPRGLALRSETRTVTISTGATLPAMPQTGTTETIQRAEVLSVESRPLDPALFRAPPDFTEVYFADRLKRFLGSTTPAKAPAAVKRAATKPE